MSYIDPDTPQQVRVVESGRGKRRPKRRPKKSRPKPDGIKECQGRLSKGAEAIQILNRVPDRGVQHVMKAVGIMTTPQTTRESKVYQSFLYDILRHAGRGLVLLCAASLGKQRVVQLNALDKTSLVRHIKDNKAVLYSPVLESLAETFQAPSQEGKCFHLL
jgi:hypothetical protein